MTNMKSIFTGLVLMVLAALIISFEGCSPKKDTKGPSLSGDEASKVYVEPGKYDEFYYFISGGFSGQVAAYEIPSGSLLKVNPE